MMRLTFHGAAREVTGSMHLVEADGLLIALDCGLFQGRRAETQEKNLRFPVDPARLHAVVLSHAHVDHCGRLPLLVRRGFTGAIHSTPATRDLAALLMADSAHIQAEDARFLNRKRARTGEPPVEPLYDEQDAATAVRLFRTVSDRRDFWITRRLRGRFLQTGHMLGACLVALEYTPPDGRPPVRLVFSGDVGRFNLPILRDPEAFPACDYLITESTYGGRRHPPVDDLKGQLAQVVNETAARRGKVIIPAFSVGRTQVIVYTLHQLREAKAIPEIPIYVDSPLAVNATEVFRLHPELFDAEARAFQRQTGDILGSGCCTYLRDAEESKKLNTRRSSCIIISASGMCETGRIVHHLRNNVQNARNTILIVGFQAEHTLGRRIVERLPHIHIFGEKLRLKAQVVVLNGFSGHADGEELGRLLRPLAPACRTAFLVHGEVDQMEALAVRLRGDGFGEVRLPAAGEAFDLNGRPAAQ
jgi:metallo-beta-lactamase family protein